MEIKREDAGVMGTKETHDSFGLMGFSRISCHPDVPLFGSSISHGQIIEMTVYKASRYRSHHHDRYHDEGLPIVKVTMSATQFTDAITQMNIGRGVPVTLQAIGRDRMPEYPERSIREEFEVEFQNDVNGVLERTKELFDRAQALVEKRGTLKKDEREELLSIMTKLKQDIGSNIPFVQRSFNEAMDKTVTEAKGEIEAHVSSTINTLGREALAERGGLVSLPGPVIVKGGTP